MDEYEAISVSVDKRGVAFLELNNPNKKNALSSQMIEELTRFAKQDAGVGIIRAVVLSGRGNYFCAGGDLNWMKAQINADRETRIKEARKLAYMLKALNEMPVPLIGKIHGGAFGGGVGLTSICDVVIAEEDAKFGLTETRLGLIPATISPYVIARLGEGMARRIFMSSRIFGAEEARDLGLVVAVHPAEKMDEFVEKEVAPYLNAAPKAVGAAKALALSLGSGITDATIERTIQTLADIWEGPEAEEGIDAFFAKRKAEWVTSDI